jgi:hypothetical protein
MERPVHRVESFPVTARNPLQDLLNEGTSHFPTGQPQQLVGPLMLANPTLVFYANALHPALDSFYFPFVELTPIEDDFCGWLADQVTVLHSRQYEMIDCDALAEELEEMGRRERDALVSDLEVALRHMLKLANETRATEIARNERQWKLDLVEHRMRARDILERSGSLNSKFDEFKDKAYERARKLAGIAIAPDQEPVGPLDCPWSKDKILQDDFFPSPSPN